MVEDVLLILPRVVGVVRIHVDLGLLAVWVVCGGRRIWWVVSRGWCSRWVVCCGSGELRQQVSGLVGVLGAGSSELGGLVGQLVQVVSEV